MYPRSIIHGRLARPLTIAALLLAGLALCTSPALALPPEGSIPGGACTSASFYVLPPDRTGADLAAVYGFDGFSDNGGADATGWSLARCQDDSGTTWLYSFGAKNCSGCFTGAVPGTVTHGKAPVIRSLSGNESGGQITALLHHTADFQLFIARVVGGKRRTDLPDGKTVLADVEDPLGAIALGLQSKGLTHLHFKLTLHGHLLPSGHYDLQLQALKPNGKLNSSSTPLDFTIAPSEALTAAEGLNGRT